MNLIAVFLSCRMLIYVTSLSKEDMRFQPLSQMNTNFFPSQNYLIFGCDIFQKPYQTRTNVSRIYSIRM